MAIREPLLVNTATKSVPPFYNGHLQSVLEKDIGAPKASKAAPNYRDVRYILCWPRRALRGGV